MYGQRRERLDRMSQPDISYPQWMQQFHDKDHVQLDGIRHEQRLFR